MSNLQEIEQAIRQLSPEDLDHLRTWLTEFDAQAWDQKLEKDVAAGRLDHLAERALQHLHAGRCTDL
jgi:hypothetical protein